MVVDLGSREGVLVNGTATPAAILAPGDVFEIAGRRLQVSYELTAPPPGDATNADTDDALSFNPTELAGPHDRPSPLAAPKSSVDSAEFMHALGPVMDRFAAYQAQTFDQFQDVMATMLRVFGAMFTEHREFVKEELIRLDNLTRVLASDRPESAVPNGRETQSFRSTTPPVPDLSVPLPPLNSGPADEQIHLWLQQRIGELGEKRASLWQKMAGMLRTKVPDGSQE